jgi:hypothetical protein
LVSIQPPKIVGIRQTVRTIRVETKLVNRTAQSWRFRWLGNCLRFW